MWRASQACVFRECSSRRGRHAVQRRQLPWVLRSARDLCGLSRDSCGVSCEYFAVCIH